MLPQPNWPDGHAEKARALIAALDAKPELAVTKLRWASGIVVAAKRSFESDSAPADRRA